MQRVRLRELLRGATIGGLFFTALGWGARWHCLMLLLRGYRQRGLVRCGVVWCGVVRCDVVRCGLVHGGVMWCSVVWFVVVDDAQAHSCHPDRAN